jgi:hypothetical protein
MTALPLTASANAELLDHSQNVLAASALAVTDGLRRHQGSLEFIRRRFLSPYVRAKWIALLPLMKPTTCETAYFGGIEIIM